jgi:glycosyltransferase involved in cell wall biosynthesis
VIEVAFAIPGDIALPTGGYAYDRNLIGHIQPFGVRLSHLPLPGGFPFPDAAERAETMTRLTALRDVSLLLIDGLAYGAFDAAMLAAVPKPVVALVHHPLGLETGLTPQQQEALLATEGEALRRARHIIATSQTTAATLVALFSLARETITVAEPGVALPERAMCSGVRAERAMCSGVRAERATGHTAPVHILSAGAVVPRKGHDVLIDALAALQDLPWRASIAGSLDRSPETARDLAERIADCGLTGRVELAGALGDEALAALYRSADVFALASRYEGYGMVFAEAMAHGLPIVATTAGAIPETVPAAAGLLVPPDDTAALATALRAMIERTDLRRMCGEAAFAHAQTLPRWSDTARRVAEVLKAVAREEMRR